MAFEELRDQIRDKLTDAWVQIQESPTYNNLREKYETLSPQAQRGLLIGGITALILFLISIPMSYLSSSNTYIEDYETDRQLIRSLLRASRLANEASNLPSLASVEEIRGQIQNYLSSISLLPEQMGSIDDLDVAALGTRLAPASIQQNGLSVSLKKLNLNQIVETGFTLQKLNPSMKLAGMEIHTSEPDPHYFDVMYKLVLFSLSAETPGTSVPARTEPTKGEENE